MALIVQKFGGSSVADAEHLKRVAARVADAHSKGNKVVVVVSAMGDTTDELLDLAAKINDKPRKRELDILMTAGERISMSLLAMAIEKLGVGARAYTGQQAGIKTDSFYGAARIVDIDTTRIHKCLELGDVAVIAGFQGINKDLNDVTTLGRGGSDTSAVAIAAALDADICEIYTDVDGVFSADPRIVKSAKKLPVLSYEEMLEMSASGSKVLALRAVEYGRRFGVPIHVRSSFSELTGTLICDLDKIGDIMDRLDDYAEDFLTSSLEAPIISGVAHDSSEAKITINGAIDNPGIATKIFEEIANISANIDMIVQNVSHEGVTDISFTLPENETATVANHLDTLKDTIGFKKVLVDTEIGKLSLIGAGMKTHSGISAKFFRALFEAGINIEMITTSEIRISVIVRKSDLDAAAIALHSAFDLDGDASEAVVYGGSGR
ncbi:MAG: aspartate kinase [Bifidobacteriaceae bacterium]|nr:aspartate kinase [Bifidobacteriaceae bacterium]